MISQDHSHIRKGHKAFEYFWKGYLNAWEIYPKQGTEKGITTKNFVQSVPTNKRLTGSNF